MIVVGIDQSMTASGWCVVRRCKPLVWGLARNARERRAVVLSVYRLAAVSGDDVRWYFEDHSEIDNSRRKRWTPDGGAPTRSNATDIGLGRALQGWIERLEDRDIPATRIQTVTPTRWRGAVLGKSAGLSTEAWKALAEQWASATVGQRIENDNVAEAIAIAMWGALAGEAKADFDRRITNHRARERRRKGKAANVKPVQTELLATAPANDNARRARKAGA